MSTTTNHKRTRIIALVAALLVVAGIIGLAPKVGLAMSDATGDLVVTKTFAGDGLAGTEEADFTITVSDLADPSGSLPTTLKIGETTITAENNVFKFSLKNGEQAKIENANPCKAKVEETALEGFTTTVSATKGDQALTEVTSLPATVEIGAKEETTVNVTNTKEATPTPTEAKGNLTISKTIAGTEDETLKATEFNFKVDLTKGGNTDNGAYSYVGSKSGTVKSGESISLKGGESVTIEGIPADTDYAVTEAKAAGWTMTKTGDTGKIAADATAKVAFTNTYESPDAGSLKISKTVSLPETEKALKEAEPGSSGAERLENRIKQAQGEQFTFKVNLKDSSDKALTDEFNYTGTLDGEEATGKIKDGGTVTLAHDDAVTITGLPEGAKYEVTEEKADNWVVDEASKKGTITKGATATASFTNTALGSLKISKSIKTASGDEPSDSLKATEFTFTVTFKENDEDVEGEFVYTGSKDGKLKSGESITLKGGESITFPNLKVGMEARVEETPVSNWQASAKALKGEIVEYSIRTATFTNTYQDSGQTGGGSLKISKTVSLPKTDEAIKEAGSSDLEKLQDRVKQAQGEKFTFVVHLANAEDMSIEDEFDYTGTEAGKDVTGKIKDGGTVTLAHNDTVTITGLPEGAKYSVTEKDADNWKPDAPTKEGTISSDDAAEASFTNTALGSLKISKSIRSVSGAALSSSVRATEFTFTLTFSEDDKEIEDEFTYTGDRSGTVKSGGTITLRGGESVTVVDLPAGIKARVAETPVANWQASAKALSGEIVEYTTRSASFINVYNDVSSSISNPRSSGTTTTTRAATPSTADDTNAAVPVVLGALAVGLVVAGRMVRSRE